MGIGIKIGRMIAWRQGLCMCVFLALAVALTACSGGFKRPSLGGFFRDDPKPPEQPVEPVVPSLQTPGQPLGGGGVKVALLLPVSGPNQTAEIGKAMKQAAELALFDFGKTAITLIQKDTAGTAQGAERAAQAAVNEGAELILGPLLAGSVSAVAPVARSRNIPVVAFSSVSSAAGSGVYLMSFLPEEEISNVVRHSVAAGNRNIAAIIPQSQYGAIIERSLNAAAARHGGQIAAVERYPRSTTAIAAPAQRLAAAVNSSQRNIQALVIPEGGQLLGALSNALIQGGLAPGKVQILGTGLWDDPATKTIPLAVGGLYAGVDPNDIAQFENRYQQAYGAKPPRLASLTYDAVSLAVALASDPQSSPGQTYSQARLTNPQGFQGVNGLFRFRPSGQIERGLAILQVNATGVVTAAPGATRFNEGF